MVWIYYILYTLIYGILVYLVLSKNGLVDKILVVITLITLIIDKISIDSDYIKEKRESIAKTFTEQLNIFLFFISFLCFLTVVIICCYLGYNSLVTTFIISTFIFLTLASFMYLKKEKINNSKGIPFALWYVVILIIYISNWIYVS